MKQRFVLRIHDPSILDGPECVPKEEYGHGAGEDLPAFRDCEIGLEYRADERAIAESGVGRAK